MFLGYHIYMNFDVIIIGAGPAGLTAGIYTSRAGKKTACFEGLAIGGQASLSYDISNYPGFNAISGFDLTQKMHEHATQVGVETIFERVIGVKKNGRKFLVETKNNKYTAKSIILASGCRARKLGLDREEMFIGRGVSYCASCDGNFYKDKTVAIIGGGDTAFENVDYLAPIVKKMYLVNRSEEFRAGEYKLNKAKKYKNLEILTNSKLIELIGSKQLEKITLEINSEKKTLDVDGVFVAIGHEPYLDYLDIDIELDDRGYIKVDKDMKTNIVGVYACGDVTSKDFRQVVTACGDGAIAGNSCIRGLNAYDD